MNRTATPRAAREATDASVWAVMRSRLIAVPTADDGAGGIDQREAVSAYFLGAAGSRVAFRRPKNGEDDCGAKHGDQYAVLPLDTPKAHLEFDECRIVHRKTSSMKRTAMQPPPPEEALLMFQTVLAPANRGSNHKIASGQSLRLQK